MTDISAHDFNDLCREGPVRGQIETVEASRKAAVRSFWLRIGGGIGASLLIAILAGELIDGTIGFIAFVVLLIGVAIFAWQPLSKVSAGIKHPVLEALAARGGMSYMPENFDPPVLAEAQPVLFGRLSGAHFTDLFYGSGEEGLHHAVYEATLTKGSGRSQHQVFSGQVYAFQRSRAREGVTVAVPDKGIFNFWKPAGGTERVKFEMDPAFEKKFEVYSTAPAEASALFGNPELRARLLKLREQGRVFVYAGPTDVLVAATGKNRFEPGSMFRSRGGEERVRLMFDDLCASLGVLRDLRRLLG